MIFLELFFAFFKTGLFAVGGGMATIPFLYEMSNTYGWFTHQDLANMIAVSESTPGPIGVNMATYVGGVPMALFGAVIATLGLITPAVIIILIIAGLLKNFRQNKYVNAAFYGLRPASAGLIASAGLSVMVTNILPEFALSALNWKGLILGVVLWVLTNKVKKVKGLHPIVFILFSAVVGVIFSMG